MHEVNLCLRAYLRRTLELMKLHGAHLDLESNGVIYQASKDEVWAALDPLRRAETIITAVAWRDLPHCPTYPYIIHKT